MMSPVLFGIAVFACAFGGALAGLQLRAALPEDHLHPESRDTVKLGVGLVATMTALVLGLITAATKGSYEDSEQGVRQAAMDVLALDRVLSRYGEETRPIREQLRRTLDTRIAAVWGTDGTRPAFDPLASGVATEGERLADAIARLQPRDDAQRTLHERALDLAEVLLKDRFLMLAGAVSSVPMPFLLTMMLWLTITFMSFGLFASRNATVITALFLCAVSVGSAVFLVLEMDSPFDGIIAVSPELLRYAAAQVGQ